MKKSTADVVIVGAGTCGALVAHRLAKVGLKISILEAGENSNDRLKFVSNYVLASTKSMGAPYKGGEGDIYAPSPDGGNDPYYDQSDLPAGFKSTYQRRVGGSTWHWRGNSPRFVPEDFKLKSLYGVGVDWPLTYDDLEPWYCEAEYELGVSGNNNEWHNFAGAFRSKPFPMSEIWPSYSDRVVASAVNGTPLLGTTVEVKGTPQARNSQPFDGRPPCAGNSTCDPICPIGAKYDATAHVIKAEAAGAQLLEKSVATELIADKSGRITAVRYKGWDGAEGEVSARVVVVAAHAIETPKLLLISRGAGQQGIANSSGAVGRYLMDHLQGQGAARLKFPVYPFRGPPTTSGIDSFRHGKFRKEHSAFRMSLGNDGWGLVQGPYAVLTDLVRHADKPLFGTELRNALREKLSTQFRLSYSTETLPDAENRVEASANLDPLGIPRPKITFKPSDYQYKAFAVAKDVIRALFTKLDATDVTISSDAKAYSSANHIIGTTRMGADSDSSVVDTMCRSHDHKNLFIVGASVFPTAGTANPTLTAVALTLRSIETMKRAVQE